MDSLVVVVFLSLLFTVQVIKPDEVQLSVVKILLQNEFGIDDNSRSSKNENSTFLSMLQQNTEQIILDNEILKIQREKLQLSHQLFEGLIDITKFRMNMTIHLSKMFDVVEEFQYRIKSLPRKKMGPFHKTETTIMVFEDIFHSMIQEVMLEEYEESLNQLQSIKIELIAWFELMQLDYDKISEIASSINKYLRDELEPEALSDDRSEDSESNFDTVENDAKIKKMINDRYNKKSTNRSDRTEQAVETEIYTHNELSEEAEFPRWIFTREDIRGIQSKYFTWMELFEDSPSSKIESLKETIINRGISIKLFCRTLAEFFSITNITLECMSNNNTECIEIMSAMLDQPHFEKFVEIISSKTFDADNF